MDCRGPRARVNYTMARTPKPTALLEAAGAFRKDPARGLARQFEPRPTSPLGDPPPCFDPLQRDIWFELAAMAPAHVLTGCDRWLVEILCRLMARLRSGEIIKAAEYSLIFAGLGRMGLTPADRSKVMVPPDDAPQPDDPFADLAADLKSGPTQ